MARFTCETTTNRKSPFSRLGLQGDRAFVRYPWGRRPDSSEADVQVGKSKNRRAGCIVTSWLH